MAQWRLDINFFRVINRESENGRGGEECYDLIMIISLIIYVIRFL